MGKLKKLQRILSSPFYTRCLLKGAAAAVEHEALLATLDLSTVVDIGANRGQFAIVSAKALPNAAIHSFEPLEAPARIFDRVLGGCERINLHRCAIGPEPSHREMFVSREDDSSSLLEMTELQTDMYPATTLAGRETVEVRRLTDCLQPQQIRAPALLKIDVQGFELEAIKGCGKLLDGFDFLYVECSFREFYAGQPLADEIFCEMHDRGFRVSGVHNATFDRKGLPVQADFLFQPRRDAASR